jgi:DNA polymerase III gamma/tau subunit
MLIQMGNANQVEATADVKKQMGAHARSFSTSDVLRMMKAFNNAAVDLRGGWQPSLSLELALAEVLDSPSESQPGAVSSPQGTPSQPKLKPVSTPKTETQPKPSAQSGATEGSAVEAQAPEKNTINAGDIIKAWKHLSASLPKSQANLSALMNSVRMIDVQGGTLILGLASDVLVSKIDKPDQIEAIQKLIKDEFGADVSVRCVVTNAKGRIPANVAQDGMVATAIQHGGEIVDTQD